VHKNEIAVADMMKSLSILNYIPKDPANNGKDSLMEVARHYQLLWATAVAHVDTETWLEGDAEGNLVLLDRNRDGVTEYDKRKLRVISELHLGELVNCMKRIDVNTNPSAVVKPRAFLATREGALYLFALISPSKINLLLNLQTRLEDYLDSAGGLKLNAYRAFKNDVRVETEPKRFVDGEFIERFLNLTDQEQHDCIEGLIENNKPVSVGYIRDMIESLRRLH